MTELTDQALSQTIKKARTVLITGGSSGIGTELVRQFAKKGDRVVFTYFNGEQRAQALAAELAGSQMEKQKEQQIEYHRFELGNIASHKALLEVLPERIDVLVNNAALGTKTVEHMSSVPEEQDEIMLRVNALGPLWLTEAILPKMEAQGHGKILFFSSVGGGITQVPGFRLSDEMSKAAVAHLGRQMSVELSYSPIDVFTVCPGATDTPMFQASTTNKLSDEQKAAFLATLPGKRMIEPAEIAALCVNLCEPAFQVLRGTVIDASLGLGAYPGSIIDL